MGSRLDLQTLLEALLGSSNVYFQPPPSVTLLYPCIVYNRNNIRSNFADNLPYKIQNQYSITVIDANPDSIIPTKVAKLPQCTFDRNFVVDNLNHNVLNLLY